MDESITVCASDCKLRYFGLYLTPQYWMLLSFAIGWIAAVKLAKRQNIV